MTNDHSTIFSALEDAKLGLEKELADLRHQLEESEKMRQEARQELQDTKRQAKSLESESRRKGAELDELRNRVQRSDIKEEDNKKEIQDLKNRVAETEINRDSLRKECANLQLKLTEAQDELTRKEREFQVFYRIGQAMLFNKKLEIHILRLRQRISPAATVVQKRVVPVPSSSLIQLKLN